MRKNFRYSVEELLSNFKKHNPSELLEALRFLLVDLISVLGSVTANILLKAVYKALYKVGRENEYQ